MFLVHIAQTLDCLVILITVPAMVKMNYVLVGDQGMYF